MTTEATTKFRTRRQEVLFQQLAEDMETYRKREQAQYLLNGMSTSHIVLHALKRPETLLEFWNAFSAIKVNSFDVARGIEKTQDAIRDTLHQLEGLGLVEKMGNEHERRWRLTTKGRWGG